MARPLAMKNSLACLLVVTIFATLSCSDEVAMEKEAERESCGENCWIFDHDNQRRSYYLHIPENLPSNAPLLFVLHGYGDNARRLSRSTLDLNQMADEKGYLVAYPQGSQDLLNQTHWNAELADNFTRTDDIGFLRELALFLQSEYNLNPTRTFTSGISNGGFMSYALVCQAPEVFKGAGSVIGTMSGKTWESCDSSIQVPILQISGIADTVVPIDGSMSLAGGWGGAPHMDEVMDRWASRANCDEKETDAVFTSSTTRIRWRGCSAGQELWYYKIEGMGHDWPWTGNAAGFSGAAELFDFLEEH